MIAIIAVHLFLAALIGVLIREFHKTPMRRKDV